MNSETKYLNKKGLTKKGKNCNIHMVYYVQARKLNQQTDVPLLCLLVINQD